MSKKKTHDEYVKEIEEVHNGNIEVTGKYINARTKITHKCKLGHEWDSLSSNVLKGQSCPKCVKKRVSESQKKTHEDYIREVEEVHNGNIEVVGEYIDSNTKIKHGCKTCNCEWETVPRSIIKGHGCRKCGGSTRKTHEDYLKELEEKHSGNIKVEGKYINNKTKILHKCNVCMQKFDMTPTYIFSGRGCPECTKVNYREFRSKSHEQYVREVEDVHNGDVEVKGKYVNAITKIKHGCRHGHEWYAQPVHIIHNGSGCPECKESKGERLIRNILESLDITFKSEVTFKNLRIENNAKLRCDFVIYKDNKPILVIEYNGEQHYKPVEIFGGVEGYKLTKKRDEIKRNILRKQGIQVVDIPYTETDEQVKSTIGYYVDTLIKKEHEFKAHTQIKST